MFWSKALAITVLGVAAAAAQTSGFSDDPAQSSFDFSDKTVSSAAKSVARPKSFDLKAMDKTVNPCEDFYEYSCGNWRKQNPIPSDQARWGRFNELAEYNRQTLHEILEKDTASNPSRSPIEQKIGDFYHSCMDESTVNAKGFSPLKPDLDRIAAISTKDQFIDAVAYFSARGGGILFGFNSGPDLHNASIEVANVAQGGLGLPDRDYYLGQDGKAKETRQKYQEHLAKMFALIGDDEAAARKEAAAVVAIETSLAQAAFERVKMRNPENRDHKMKVSELAALAPNFQFERYFAATGAPAFSEVNVVPPDFFQKVNGTIDSVSVEDWKSYLRSHVLRGAAPFLSEPFVQENYNFFSAYLNGTQQIQPRWKRCEQTTDRLLGEALGQPYVQQTFGEDGKQRMLKMVSALEGALSTDIQELSWMTSETKKQAEVKLRAITNKIGFPDHWRDYTSVKIDRNNLLGNVLQASAFDRKRALGKIGKPLDKSEWGMTPPTVNAYYNAAENDINFPAGILQPPFFDKTQDDAVNFGGIGVVIGHELTHGFDDQGSKFDGNGNFTNWWSDSDKAEFEKRTSCVADEYSSFVSVDELHLNGRLTLGENTADNGGIRIAYAAMHNALKDSGKQADAKKDGFTADQRFFLGFAQIWCENHTPESARLLVKTDPHSPGRFRVNGTVQNDPDFAKAFGCKTGQKMVSDNACHVW
ncbi:MAG TPA: M13 family metallopeptidase [Candidatus Angelobacter sp.]|nr:M13 family metallopeptidase [Candidatus Angelobacter sp.]